MLFMLYTNRFFTVFNEGCTRSAARDWNNAKHFLVAFSQSWNRFYLKSLKEPFIYGAHTERGLIISPVFAVHFCGGGVRGGWSSQNWSFFVDVVNVCPLIINSK